MENINIQTSQNVEILHRLAGIGNRILATLLDLLFLGIFSILIGSLLSAIRFSSPAIYIILLVLPTILYHIVCEVFMNGQSLGKKILKIKVVMLDGSQPSFSAYVTRWIFRLIDTTVTMGSVAVLFIIFSKKGQRLGDVAAGTTVIKEAQAVSLDHLLVNVNTNHAISFQEVSNLKESDIQTLREVMHFYKSSYGSAKSVAILNKSRIKIEASLGVSSTLNDVDFVNTILKDYNLYVI